ncbi:unnamed protein product [Prunus armeniaca]
MCLTLPPRRASIPICPKFGIQLKRSVSPAQRDIIGEQFKIALKEYWLNPTAKDLTETRKLWKKQWKVHGKYSDMLAKDYFNLPFKFYGDVNVTRMFEDAGSFSWDGFLS